MKAPSLPPHRRNSAAFTLVEIMIVVIIIGLLAALAIPRFQRIQRATQNNVVANDFRVFSQAFEGYSLQHGSWPDNAGPGTVPPGMGSDDFRTSTWESLTPIGGQWDWKLDVAGFTAGISIVGFTCSESQLAEIDAKLDDGNLTTGNFQLIEADRVLLVMDR